MLQRITLPLLSENTRSATVVKVLVAKGDIVEEHTPLFEMVTDKAEFEFESTAAGSVQALFASENAEVPVGFILALVGDEKPSQAELDEAEAENRRALDAFREAVDVAALWEKEDTESAGAPEAGGSRIRATPKARRLAKEQGVDLAEVKRSLGLEGMVREEDIKRFVEGEK